MHFFYFTNKDYTEEFVTFIRTAKYRSGVMTSARIQPFCRKHKIKKGCYDGYRICPRNNTKRDTSIFVYNKRFCVIWKSSGISFNQAIQEVKENFKIFDNVVSDKHNKFFVKYEHKTKKAQSPLMNIIVYDLETFINLTVIPHCSCIYKQSESSGKYN